MDTVHHPHRMNPPGMEDQVTRIPFKYASGWYIDIPALKERLGLPYDPEMNPEGTWGFYWTPGAWRAESIIAYYWFIDPAEALLFKLALTKREIPNGSAFAQTF